MKLKLLLLNLLTVLFIVSCNGQEKPKTISSKEKSDESSLTDSFYKLKNLCFNSDEKLIFSSELIKNKGKFTVYYIPFSEQNNNYYNNFEKNNDITLLYDELNSTNYYSPSDKKKIEAILREKTKKENDFAIIGTYIPKEFITIESDDEYSVNFPFTQKYYKKENDKWVFLFEKKISKAEDEINYNSKKYITSLSSQNKQANNPTKSYSANGRWLIDCENGVGKLTIKDKEASLIVLYNQIYIDMIELKRNDAEKGIAYKLKEIPEDIGIIGKDLNWKEYVNDEPIAYIKFINDKTIKFYWYGFYNKKTKKREFDESNFNQETPNKEIVLKLCPK